MRVYAYKTKEEEGGTPYDFCRYCERGLDLEALNDIVDGNYVEMDRDCDHPDYEGEGYTCDDCGEELTNRDN
jgi:hypothetical protein